MSLALGGELLRKNRERMRQVDTSVKRRARLVLKFVIALSEEVVKEYWLGHLKNNEDLIRK